MKIKIKKLDENAVIPSYAKTGDAGMDLTAIDLWEDSYGYVSYRTGLSIEIPEGYVGLIYPRSSISKHDYRMCNSVGVIDSGYRGEIEIRFRGKGEYFYEIGERVAQLIIMPYPQVEFEEVTELSETERMAGGFGSSGK